MFPKSTRSRLQQTWWWVFSLLIAAPALVLAGLGLRAVRADRIEREQQLREQQIQIARLADAALANAVERVVARLDRIDTNALIDPDPPTPNQRAIEPFILDGGGVLSFPDHGVYFGAAGQMPEFLQAQNRLPAPVFQLISDAQAMEAQQRKTEAIALYREAKTNPVLHDWAALALARLDEHSVDVISDRHWAASTAYTPSGLPIAIVASSAVQHAPARDRLKFAALIRDSLGNLRRGLWWLNYEQRRVYDSELRRWLDASGGSGVQTDDPGLDELAQAEQVIRHASEDGGTAPRIETQDGQAFLIVWSHTEGLRGTTGAVVSRPALEALISGALRPIFDAQPFAAALHHQDGQAIWSSHPLDGTPWRTESLNAVQGLQLRFTGPSKDWAERNRWMGYGFVLLPAAMLMLGLAMTVRVVRRELALNQMQSRFLAAVSHELKSPITGIRLLMERISEGRRIPPDAARDYYVAIDRETDRLEALVNRLLESQKIQAEARRYNFEPISLTELAGRAIQRLLPQAEAKGIRLRSDAESGIPEIELDQAAIGDAIENLVENAIKYSPAGTQVSICIRAAEGEASIEVCDEGIGIENADLPRIFDPFYRGRRGDMESVKGAGLGLALVKAAAAAHGGAIEVSSRPDRGSRFTLRLPIMRRA